MLEVIREELKISFISEKTWVRDKTKLLSLCTKSGSMKHLMHRRIRIMFYVLRNLKLQP